MSSTAPALLVDLSLSRRLETAEACAGASFVEARFRRNPGSGATWIEIAGVYVIYDGEKSPVSQTFGLGLFDRVTHAEMERIEAFYQDRGSPVHHTVSPLADKTLLALLTERHYAPIELTSVMFRPLQSGEPKAQRDYGITTRVASENERELWARTAAEGWSDSVDLGDVLHEFMAIAASREDAISFLAERNGEAIAAGALFIEGGIALLSGASTIPKARRLGAQQALLDARRRYASGAGCDLAMICAEPGSASQRNAERHGFRIAYTRIKWKKL